MRNLKHIEMVCTYFYVNRLFIRNTNRSNNGLSVRFFIECIYGFFNLKEKKTVRPSTISFTIEMIGYGRVSLPFKNLPFNSFNLLNFAIEFCCVFMISKDFRLRSRFVGHPSHPIGGLFALQPYFHTLHAVPLFRHIGCFFFHTSQIWRRGMLLLAYFQPSP